MRIATWNLERGGRTLGARSAQERTLRALAADVTVLTEPPASYRAGAGVVASPAQRAGPRGDESWVAVVGSSVEPVPLGIPFDRTAVAARATAAGRTVIVYGALLPWLAVTRHAPELVREGETSFDAFIRVLREQAADVAELRRVHGESVVWAGDFNQTVVGPNLGGSAQRRAALIETLHCLGFAAWNAEARHARAGMCAIDLICGTRGQDIVGQGWVDPVAGGVVMSDHAGYWVEI